MDEYHANSDLQKRSNPLDTYTEMSVHTILQELKAEKASTDNVTDIYFCHDTRPDRLISFQRLAYCSALAHYSPELGLCLHPKYGAWLAFRSALVFDSRRDKHISAACTKAAAISMF